MFIQYQAYYRPKRGKEVTEVGVTEINEGIPKVQFRMELANFVDWQDAYNLAALMAKTMNQVQAWLPFRERGS